MVKNEKQTLGEFLREARTEKGISIDEIVRDTNIPKRYLESIEADNFDVFPGETYALGFISTYADALEVDKELAATMYKRQMKIEQDSPIEQLVGKKKQFMPNMNIVFTAGIGFALLLVIFLIYFLVKQNSGKAISSEINTAKNYVYTFDELGKIANQKFRIGDSLAISNDTKLIVFNFTGIGPSKSLILKINNTEYNIKNGDLLSVDTDKNGTNDMGIEIFSAKENDIKLSISMLKESPESYSAAVQDDIYNKYKESILSESELFTAKVKTAADIKIVSTGYGWLSYSADSKEEKEVYLNNGTSVTVNFINNMVLYLGNSGAAKIIVNNKEEDGGGWGEVNKSIFYWKNKNGQFVLVRATLK